MNADIFFRADQEFSSRFLITKNKMTEALFHLFLKLPLDWLLAMQH